MPPVAPPPLAPLPLDFGVGRAPRTLTLLPDCIPGVATAAHFIPAAQSLTFPPPDCARRLLFVVSGDGSVQAPAAAPLEFTALALLILPATAAVTLSAAAPLTLLEIRFAQTPEELASAAAAATTNAPPPDAGFVADLRLVAYAACPTYREAIKSPQTVNRTLVPPGWLPRFAMGSVETAGPDAVAPHAHPMLEQLFFGLPGNDCTVTADGAAAAFGGPTLLYIPRGSLHGATVAAGRRLHYLWLDFFPTAADMQWIRDQHIDNPAPPASGDAVAYQPKPE